MVYYIKQLGHSISSGQKQNNSAVDNFLGKSLQDNRLLLTAINKQMNYGVNLLNTADQYYNSIADALQSGMNAVVSAGSLSDDKIAILQESLTKTKKQIEYYINNANFDGRKLFSGDAANINVRTGAESDDTMNVYVRDISQGKLFRLTIVDAFNDYFAADHTRTYGVYTADTLKTAVKNNENLWMKIYDTKIPGRIGVSVIKGRDVMAIVYNTIKSNPSISALLTKINPITNNKLKAAGLNFVTASQAQLLDALMKHRVAVPGVVAGRNDQSGCLELVPHFTDNQDIKIGHEVEREITYNVWHRALDVIRSEQASLSNQKNNLIAASGAISASAETIGQVEKELLDTNFKDTMEEFSKLLYQNLASIAITNSYKQMTDATLSLVRH